MVPTQPCKACASKLFERELVVEWVRLNVINRKPGSSLSYFREGKYEHLCPSKCHMWEEPMENYLGFFLNPFLWTSLWSVLWTIISASAEPAASRVAGRIWSGYKHKALALCLIRSMCSINYYQEPCCLTLCWLTVPVCPGTWRFPGMQDFQCWNWDRPRQTKMVGYSIWVSKSRPDKILKLL